MSTTTTTNNNNWFYKTWDLIEKISTIIALPYIVTHEFGHYLGHKCIDPKGAELDIHIGLPESEDHRNYARPGFHFHGLNPTGYYRHNIDRDHAPTQAVIVTIAGPVFGFGASLLLFKLCPPLYTGFVVNEILYGFTPICGSNSDGYKFFQYAFYGNWKF